MNRDSYMKEGGKYGRWIQPRGDFYIRMDDIKTTVLKSSVEIKNNNNNAVQESAGGYEKLPNYLQGVHNFDPRRGILDMVNREQIPENQPIKYYIINSLTGAIEYLPAFAYLFPEEQQEQIRLAEQEQRLWRLSPKRHLFGMGSNINESHDNPQNKKSKFVHMGYLY